MPENYARTRAVLAAVAVGRVYRRDDSGDLLYTPADSIRVGAEMADLQESGMAELQATAAGPYWAVTPAGAAWLADCAAAEVQA